MDMEEFKALFANTPQKYPFVFEKRHRALLTRILDYWDMPIEAEAYFDKLIAAAANHGGSTFAPDARMDLINIRESFKAWRLSQKPRAPMKTLHAISAEQVNDILAQLLPPTPDVVASMKTALEMATADDPNIGLWFAEHGLSINQRDMDGTTALMVCSKKGSERAALALLKAGANPHIPDGMGNCALHWAVMHSKRRMAEMLLYFGAAPNGPNIAGTTPYGLSVIKEDSTIAQRLYEYGADIATQDLAGNTPLHKAIAGSSVENVWLLLQAGAAKSARNKAGLTPYELAEKNPEIARIFDKHQVAAKQAAI